MQNPPKGIDLQFSSFSKKPAFQTLGNAKKPKSKYQPGGDWAEDSGEEPALDLGLESGGNYQTGPKKEDEPKLNNEVDFDFFNKPEKPKKPVKAKKKGSKFGFIKKNKDKRKNNGKQVPTQTVLISLPELRNERYAYPRKIVNSIVEPIGARKRPSEGVLQSFIRQTANFDPRIVLSILFHILGESPTVWLSKYRALVATEALLSRNNDYSQAMENFRSEFVERVEMVCEGFEFSQKSHQQLVVKVKQSVAQLVRGTGEERGKTSGFDFGKMNEMMSKMDKDKSGKNGNFLEQMNSIKKKAKGKKAQKITQKDPNDLLMMDIGQESIGGQLQPQSEDLLGTNANTSQPNPQNDDLLILDFTSSNNNQQTKPKTKEPTNAQSSNNGDLDLFDLTGPGMTNPPQPKASTEVKDKYDDLDFL